MTTAYRHAIFACPDQDDPLTVLAARWLGRDAWSGGAVVQPDVPDIAELTSFPRRYGFHATVVAPFRPADGVGAQDIDGALDVFVTEEAPIPLPLRVDRLGAFFALVPDGPSAPLDAMAERAVRQFHPYRAEPTADETARRRPERLSERQREHLARWHYPYVMDEFRYHMTLTGPVPEADAARVRETIGAHFAADILAAHRVDALARYVEPEPASFFAIARRARFAAVTRRAPPADPSLTTTEPR